MGAVRSVLIPLFLSSSSPRPNADVLSPPDDILNLSWQTLIWRLPPTLAPRSATRTFTGSFTTDQPPLPAPSVLLTAKIHQHSLSGLKINQLKVGGLGGPGGEQPKMFRGVRGRVEVKIEGRW